MAPRPGEHDDDQLVRRSLMLFAAPYEPGLAAEARRLAAAWVGDRKAIDPGLVDAVLIVAARTGDTALFDAMLAEARATDDRLDRRNLVVALMSFGSPELASKGLGLQLDPAFDIREVTDALWRAHHLPPPRDDIHIFIVAHFDALAARVSREAPSYWPAYAERLCSATARTDVEAFWRDRIARYPGSARVLAQALEAIESCARLREAQQASLRAYLNN
jgi:hypothetical protein